MEKVKEWVSEHLQDLSPGKVMAYFFGWVSCCIMIALTLNVILPSWARWFKTADDFWIAFGLLVTSIIICGITSVSNSED